MLVPHVYHPTLICTAAITPFYCVTCLLAIHLFQMTALHIAASQNKSGACRMLLEHGADPSIRNSEGMSCLDIALKYHFHDVCLEIISCDRYVFECIGMSLCMNLVRNPASGTSRHFATSSVARLLLRSRKCSHKSDVINVTSYTRRHKRDGTMRLLMLL